MSCCSDAQALYRLPLYTFDSLTSRVSLSHTGLAGSSRVVRSGFGQSAVRERTKPQGFTFGRRWGRQQPERHGRHDFFR